MYKAKYRAKELIIGNGENTAIITGWSARELVARRLNPKDYAVIGNLYTSVNGISPLIRNLLLNPQIQFLILLEATKEDENKKACKCFFDFINNGFKSGTTKTGRNTWVINSEITGYIDYEISEESLNTLRKSVIVFYCSSLESVKDVIKRISVSLTQNLPIRKKQEFPESKYTPITLSGEIYGHIIRENTIAEAWLKILQKIKTTGLISPSKSGLKLELIDLITIVEHEPSDFYFPDPNYLPISREFIDNYLVQIMEDSEYKEGVKYTYGQRLRSWFGTDQIQDCIFKLVKDINSTSAVMNLWDSGSGGISQESDFNQFSNIATSIARFGRNYADSDHDHEDPPCLNHIWLRIIDSKLSLTATFRSNDMFSAWPANAMGLRALQEHIKEEINKWTDYNLKLAPLIIISQSAHIYEDCWQDTDDIVKKYLSVKPNYSDPIGNFLINIKDQEIIVERTDKNGNTLVHYKEKNPLKLIRKIAFDCSSISPDHIGYLGIEIQKAFTCIKQGFYYEQDR